MLKVMCCGLLLVAVNLVGCATSAHSPSRYTQAQLNAIETRDVDATFDETFSAASNALFDAGYTIAMSDRSAGLITGEAGKDNTAARFWVSPLIQDSRFRISMQVRQTAPKLCAVRVKTSSNGEPVVDKKAIDNIWTLMQRQVMMKAPLDPTAVPTALQAPSVPPSGSNTRASTGTVPAQPTSAGQSDILGSVRKSGK